MKLTSSMTALLLGGGAMAAAGYALGQGFLGITPYKPTGTEQVSVRPLTPTGVQGAYETVVPMNVISNRNGYILYTSSITASGTVTISTATDEVLVTVQPNTATWVLPSATLAFDGEQFQFCNVSAATFATDTQFVAAGASTTINVGGASSQSSTSVTTLASQTCLELVYASSTAEWYRIR